ncbi:YhbY family RNA-binding protein [Geoalkalibacter subterraneus]|uniref:YhbY family RNA-binding protein n=1 Tax=Geoalkalibacter subterraneus TaxID=483547 RepID=UPI001F43A636|nr:YhbY family RNA-binding protein [Geoalkalibacter subterraneus]
MTDNVLGNPAEGVLGSLKFKFSPRRNLKVAEIKLTGKQARYLRSLGHHLEAVIMVGKDGVTDNLVESTDESLVAHELVKIKLQRGCPRGESSRTRLRKL